MYVIEKPIQRNYEWEINQEILSNKKENSMKYIRGYIKKEQQKKNVVYKRVINP